MYKAHTPDTLRAPFGNYSHAIEVPAGARLLVCSGQLGVGLADEIPADVEAQARQCFDNIGAILKSADMGFENLIRLNAYVTDRRYFAEYMKVRDQYVSSPPPASTLMVVSGFTHPECLVEIEALAARTENN